MKRLVIILNILVVSILAFSVLTFNRLSSVKVDEMAKNVVFGSVATVQPTPKCVSTNGLPDHACTPGRINVAFVGFTGAVDEKALVKSICNPHWSTKTIRPPVSYTNALKVEQLKEYGYVNADPKAFEEDHLLSLEDGGDPRDPHGLWPEPLHLNVGGFDAGAKTKDVLENRVKKNLCSGKQTLQQAADCLTLDWVACYRQMIGELPVYSQKNP